MHPAPQQKRNIVMVIETLGRWEDTGGPLPSLSQSSLLKSLPKQPVFSILNHSVLRFPYRTWRRLVSVVTISSKWQVVIPKDVREKLRIRPGQKVQAFAVGDRIELVPVVPLEQLKGFLKGLVPDFEREPDRL